MNQQKAFTRNIVIVAMIFIIFCPYVKSQEWETLAEIPEGLTFPMVTVLEGQIHVIGGGGSGGATDVHYAYDPGTDTWTSLSPVPYLAQMPGGAAAARKIHYFGGGYPNSGSPLDDHYIYDPGTDSWTQATSLTAPRAIHYGISLNDEVYTMAGQGVTNLFEVFDTVTQTWVQKANLPDNYFMYSARCTANEKIYRFGGGAYAAPKNYAVVYDPALNEWSDLPDFPVAIHAPDASAIGDSIYVTGGLYDAYVTNEVWIYDIASQSYSVGPAMPIERYYHSAVTIDDCIYVVGGYHPIFPDSVRVSLMRYCPYGNVGINEPAPDILEKVNIKINGHGINLEFPAGLKEEVHLNVLDIMGRNVYSAVISTHNSHFYSFSLEGCSKAIYVLTLTNGKEQYSRKLYIP